MTHDGDLYRIDPTSNTEATPVNLDKQLCGEPVAALGELFVTYCEGGPTAIVDPATMKLAGSFPNQALQPAIGAGSIWATSELGPPTGSVVRIDPVTHSVKATIKVGGMPEAIAFGASSAWVANAADGTVSRIDPSTNTVTATIKAGVAGDDVNELFALGSVWVSPSAQSSSDNARFWRIDPATNAATEFSVPDALGFVAAGDSKALWVSTASGVVEIDASSLKIIASLPVPKAGPVLAAYGSVWVAVLQPPSVWRLRSAT